VDFINGIADDGFSLLAGPLREGNPYRAMLVVDADGPDEVEVRLEDDPWTSTRVLETRSIDRREGLVGEFASG
jgi:hypothetical protein